MTLNSILSPATRPLRLCNPQLEKQVPYVAPQTSMTQLASCPNWWDMWKAVQPLRNRVRAPGFQMRVEWPSLRDEYSSDRAMICARSSQHHPVWIASRPREWDNPVFPHRVHSVKRSSSYRAMWLEPSGHLSYRSWHC